MDDSGKVPDINPNDFQETPEYRAADSSAPVQEPQQQEPQQQEQPRTEILQDLQSKGYDVSSYQSDDEFITDTETKYASNRQDDQRRAQAESEQRREYLESPERPDPNLSRGNAPQTGSATGDVPQFDPSWANLVEDDGAGRYVVRPEYVGSVSPEIADRVNDYVSFRQDRSNRLIDDPVNTVLQAGLEQRIQQQINSTVQNAMSATTVRTQAAGFVKENEKTLYRHDENTGQPKRTSNGEPILSPVGQALNEAHIVLRKQGMHDPGTRHQVAMQMVQNYFTQQQMAGQQQMPQQPPPGNQDHKQQYVDQPFSEPTNPYPPGYMPNTPVQPNANALGSGGLPEHNSLGSLATALAVHKGFLQPK